MDGKQGGTWEWSYCTMACQAKTCHRRSLINKFQKIVSDRDKIMLIYILNLHLYNIPLAVVLGVGGCDPAPGRLWFTVAWPPANDAVGLVLSSRERESGCVGGGFMGATEKVGRLVKFCCGEGMDGLLWNVSLCRSVFQLEEMVLVDAWGPLGTTLELSGAAVDCTILLSESCGLVVGGRLIPSLVAWVTGGGGIIGRDCCCIDGSGSVVPKNIIERIIY